MTRNHLTLGSVGLISLRLSRFKGMLYASTLTLLLSSIGQGALLYSISTDSTGAFTSGGWTDTVGTAVVGADAGKQTISPAVPNGSGGTATLLTGFTAGVLDLGTVTPFGGTLPAGTTATLDLALDSGTADLNVNTIALSGGTVANPNGFAVQSITGADSLTVEFNWSVPIAASFGAMPRFNDPFLGAVRSLAAGSWDVTVDYLGLLHTTDGVTLQDGLPTGATAMDAQYSESSWGTDGASSSWTMTKTGGLDWQAIHGFEAVDSSAFTSGVNGDSTLQDAEAVYATGIRYTITNNTGGSLDGASFLFSTHGTQWADTINLPVIPEPSSGLLLALASTAGLLRRRQK